MKLIEILKILVKPLPSIIWKATKKIFFFLLSERFRDWIKLISMNTRDSLNGFNRKYGERGLAFIMMALMLVFIGILYFLFT